VAYKDVDHFDSVRRPLLRDGHVAGRERSDDAIVEWRGEVVGAADRTVRAAGQPAQQHLVAAEDQIVAAIFHGQRRLPRQAARVDDVCRRLL
jgi:hypothetical protein